MRLTITIPAYNEEEGIESICKRTLAAKPEIISQTPVTDVHIVVVSDGSWDKTPQIAAQIPGIDLISYEKNKGYGAAIKMGFNKFEDELVSFLDADGTCDPLFFIPLINEMECKKYDVILGSRMSSESKIAAIRIVGNLKFSNLLKFLSGSKVKDTVSVSRLIRRSALPTLYPLPNGLHFTPAMSAKAIFDKTISIGEIPMPYEERIGESKLNPLKDGIRFLRVIIETAVQYAPHIIFNISGLVMVAIALILSFLPFSSWITGDALEDWMIYRIFTSFVLLNAGTLLFCTGQVAKGFLRLIHYRGKTDLIRAPKVFTERVVTRHGLLLGFVLLIVSAIILYNPLVELLSKGTITLSWWSFLVGELFFLLGFVFITSGSLGVIQKLLSIEIVEKNKLV